MSSSQVHPHWDFRLTWLKEPLIYWFHNCRCLTPSNVLPLFDITEHQSVKDPKNLFIRSMHCIISCHFTHAKYLFNDFNQTKFFKCKRWPVKIHVISGRVHRWEMLSQRISSGCSKERYNNGLWCCCSRKFCIYAISHGRHSCAKRRNFLQEAQAEEVRLLT